MKKLHIQEYATFVSAQGQLAVAEGERERAENILEMLAELIGEDEPAYIMLAQALYPSAPGIFSALRNMFGDKT